MRHWRTGSGPPATPNASNARSSLVGTERRRPRRSRSGRRPSQRRARTSRSGTGSIAFDPARPRRRLRRAGRREGAADADHAARRRRRRLPGLPRGDAGDAACGPPARSPVHGARASRSRTPTPSSRELLEFTASPPRRTPDVERWLDERFGMRRSRGSGGPSASTGRSCMPRPGARGRSARRPSYVGARTSGAPGRRGGLDAVAGPPVPRGLRARDDGGYRPVRRPSTGRRSRTRSSRLGDELVRDRWPRRRDPVRRPRWPAAAGGHAGAAASPADVGQRAPRVQGPCPDRAARVPHASSCATTVMCCRRCSSTASCAGVVASGRRRASRPTAFHRLSDDDWAGLDAEARSLVAFLAESRSAGLPGALSLIAWHSVPVPAEVRLDRPS